MVRILIADDELPIREWLKYTIEKLEEPIEICALCVNGDDALEKYAQFHPDLIFTDIKMPGKDGIELLKALRASPRRPYIVILTSHDSFEYARSSLKYGANEYILKSEIDVELLSRVVRSCIEEKRSAPEEAESASMLELLNAGDADRRLRAILGQSDPGDFFVVAAPLRGSHELLNLRQNRSLLAGDGVEDVHVFYYNSSIALVLIRLASAMSGGKTHAIRVAVADQLMRLLNATLGVSQLRCGKENLLKTVEEAVRTQELCFYAGAPRVLYAEENIGADQGCFEEQVNHALREISAKRIVKSICSIRALLSETSTLRVRPEFLRERVLALVVGYRFIALNWNCELVIRACALAEAAIREVDSFRALCAEMESLLAVIEDTLGNEYSQYVRMAISQVHDHYADIHRITDVSDQLNLNAEYFCRIFKAETGSTFNTFLTNFRMKLACDLLKNTEMKIIDIGRKVGYENLSYFSRVFKAYAGMNPFRYREEQANSKEQQTPT